MRKIFYPQESEGQDDINIFYLSRCAFTSAEWLHEKHTVKMITESAQILSTAVQLLACETDERLYKCTHIFHPCVHWVMHSVWHYEWLMNHYICLARKYNRIFAREHAAYYKLSSILREYYGMFPRDQWIDPPKCMPEQFRHYSTVDECYRRYYAAMKCNGRCFYKVNPPFWLHRRFTNNGMIKEHEDSLEGATDQLEETYPLVEIGP